LAIANILAFFPNELLKFTWVGSGIDGGWRSRCSIHGDASIPSRRRKCTRPDALPATMVTPSGVTAQQYIELSPVKLAMTSPVSRFHSFRVLSSEPEIARLPSAVTATALTQLL